MNLSNEEFVKTMNHPYRNSSKDEIKKAAYTPILEERIQSFRHKIPGPIRRLLAVLLIVPVHILSVFAAVFIVAPILYIATGKWNCWFDSYNDDAAPRLCLRGTYVLFFNYDKWDIRHLRRKHGLSFDDDDW